VRRVMGYDGRSMVMDRLMVDDVLPGAPLALMYVYVLRTK
jgi:hypothetical protein